MMCKSTTMLYLHNKVTMKTYAVEVCEAWKRCFTVEANSEEEAREKANDLITNGDADAEEDSFEFSHMEDVDEWYVQDISNQIKEFNKS